MLVLFRQIMEFLNKDKRLEIPRDCPLPVRDIMKRCWLKELEDRPTFEQIQRAIDEFIRQNPV